MLRGHLRCIHLRQRPRSRHEEQWTRRSNTLLRIYVCQAWKRPKEDSQRLRTKARLRSSGARRRLRGASWFGPRCSSPVAARRDEAKTRKRSLGREAPSASKVYQLGNIEDDQYETASAEIKSRSSSSQRPGHAHRTLAAATNHSLADCVCRAGCRGASVSIRTYVRESCK